MLRMLSGNFGFPVMSPNMAMAEKISIKIPFIIKIMNQDIKIRLKEEFNYSLKTMLGIPSGVHRQINLETWTHCL